MGGGRACALSPVHLHMSMWRVIRLTLGIQSQLNMKLRGMAGLVSHIALGIPFSPGVAKKLIPPPATAASLLLQERFKYLNNNGKNSGSL